MILYCKTCSERKGRPSIYQLLLVVTGFGMALLFGCDRPPEDESLNACRDALLAAAFTPDAAAVLRNVPLRYGEVAGIAAYATDDAPLSRIICAAFGNGFADGVLLSRAAAPSCSEGGPLVPSFTLFHEFLHEADFHGLIDRELFRSRFMQMSEDPAFGEQALAFQEFLQDAYIRSNNSLAVTWGDQLTIELLAHAPVFWLDGSLDLPDYMLEVYNNTIALDSLSEQRESHRRYVADLVTNGTPLICSEGDCGESASFYRDLHYRTRSQHPFNTQYECSYCNHQVPQSESPCEPESPDTIDH